MKKMDMSLFFKPPNSRGAPRVNWRLLPAGSFSSDADVKSDRNKKGRIKGQHTCFAGKERKRKTIISHGSGTRKIDKDHTKSKFYGE